MTLARGGDRYLDNILDSVKKVLGIDPAYDAFDVDIIMHVNSVLAILTQMGVGPEEGFAIKDSTETWTDFLGEDSVANLTEMVKSYVCMKVRLLFDTVGITGAALASFERVVTELEWRISVAVDPGRNDEV